MDKLLRQHYRLATSGNLSGGDDGDESFGVRPIGAGHIKHPDAGKKGDYLPDGKRAIGKPIKLRSDQAPAQAHPDHGPMLY